MNQEIPEHFWDERYTICPVCGDTFTYTSTNGCCGFGCAEKHEIEASSILLQLILEMNSGLLKPEECEHLKQVFEKARKSKPKYHRAWGGVTLYPYYSFAKTFPKLSHFGKAAVRIGKNAMNELIQEYVGLSTK
jgi:hypothetical protein